MKAAVVSAAGQSPAYTDFEDPVAASGEVLVRVTASAMSHLAQGRASGRHYSAGGSFPLVAGVDGVGTTPGGQRVYFVLPRAPFGAMAALCPVPEANCLPLGDAVDDVTAAALANPGMSAWAALEERAGLVRGETVLVNGATGVAGRVAVQLARRLGAGRILVAGRNAAELEALRPSGADVVLPFDLASSGASVRARFEADVSTAIREGLDVVVDYLWGDSALAIMTAVAKTVEVGKPVRFVQVGTAGGQDTLALPGAALRSSPLQLMGSGLKSVPLPTLVKGIGRVFELAAQEPFALPIRAVPLEEVGSLWATAGGKPRVVFTLD